MSFWVPRNINKRKYSRTESTHLFNSPSNREHTLSIILLYFEDIGENKDFFEDKLLAGFNHINHGLFLGNKKHFSSNYDYVLYANICLIQHTIHLVYNSCHIEEGDNLRKYTEDNFTVEKLGGKNNYYPIKIDAYGTPYSIM